LAAFTNEPFGASGRKTPKVIIGDCTTRGSM
jgi:hypothetical protein